MDGLSDLASGSAIGNLAPIGIAIALVGAVFLSLGAQFQHRGVELVEERHGSGAKAGLSVGQLMRLLARPSWVIGSVMLGLAILFQLTSLTFAPLIVVQPIGAVALVITTIVNARLTKIKIQGTVLRAVGFCVGGIALFVGFAAFVAKEQVIEEPQLIIVLSILIGVTCCSDSPSASPARRSVRCFTSSPPACSTGSSPPSRRLSSTDLAT